MDSAGARSQRRAWWAILGGIVALLLTLVGALLWWLMPTWQPEWVSRYCPFPEPVFRAANSGADWGTDGTPLAERLTVSPWRTTALRYLLNEIQRPDRDRRFQALRWIKHIPDPVAAETIIRVLQGASIGDAIRS